MSERQPDVTVSNSRKVFSPKTGERTGVTRRVSAEFRKGGVPDWALPLALQVFPMNGKPYETPPARYLCTYDSILDQQQRGWSDEERELIEAALRAKPGVVEISPPKVAAPWPKYSSLVVKGQRSIEKVVEQILAGIAVTGADPAQVIAFERQELNRPEVIEAVEALRDGDAEEAEPLIAA